ncbi:MAG: chemotaxis protein CheX [Nitrospirae bacterium]|nr:chemotaxis protein CheX [Nitrospirota bacterium]
MSENGLDAIYAACFIDGTEELFRTMLGLAVNACVLETDAPRPKADVSAIVGLGGTAAAGSFVLSFERATALRVISRFLGSEVREMMPDGADGVCEIANIIVGRALALLRSGGIAMSMSIPQVILGGVHSIAGRRDTQGKVVRFDSDLGPFTAEIRIRQEMNDGPGMERRRES